MKKHNGLSFRSQKEPFIEHAFLWKGQSVNGASIAFFSGSDTIAMRQAMRRPFAAQMQGRCTGAYTMNVDQRRQLKNDYKRKPATGAIYAIDCSGNQRRIIKSTVDIGGIKSRFQFAMAIKGCPDPMLNNEWLQFGAESFSLVVLEELKMQADQSPQEFAADVKQLHELWLEKLDGMK